MKTLRIGFLIVSLGAICWLAQWLYWPSAYERAETTIRDFGGTVDKDCWDAHPGVNVLIVNPVSDDEHDIIDALNVVDPSALELRRSTVTDRGLERLSRLSKLRMLALEKANITDAGLACLAVLPALQDLNVRSCAITDDGIKHIKVLNNLKVVNLADTQVTIQGLQDLRDACPDLRIRTHLKRPTPD